MTCTLALGATKTGIVGIKLANGSTKIPWFVGTDNAWFRGLTYNRRVVLGSTTYAELKKFLPYWGCSSIAVLTTRDPYGYEAVHPRQAEHVATTEDILVIGGAQTYRTFLPYATHVALTIIPDAAIEALNEGDEYIYARDLLEGIETGFAMKQTMKWTQDCVIKIGARK